MCVYGHPTIPSVNRPKIPTLEVLQEIFFQNSISSFSEHLQETKSAEKYFDSMIFCERNYNLPKNKFKILSARGINIVS